MAVFEILASSLFWDTTKLMVFDTIVYALCCSDSSFVSQRLSCLKDGLKDEKDRFYLQHSSLPERLLLILYIAVSRSPGNDTGCKFDPV